MKLHAIASAGRGGASRATASGLGTQAKGSGTWIMWSGTPYAHLMIMQHP